MLVQSIKVYINFLRRMLGIYSRTAIMKQKRMQQMLAPFDYPFVDRTVILSHRSKLNWYLRIKYR